MMCLLVCMSIAGFQHGLAEYVGKDLAKLSSNESKQFNQRLQATTKEKRDPNEWQIPIPRWIKPYHVGKSEWLYLAYDKAHSVPGSGIVQVFGFDEQWRLTCKSLFSTGYRLSPTKVEFLNLDEFTQPILHIHVESLGPFVVEGKKKSPAFHPATGVDLYCAFDDSDGHMIRVTSGDGKLINNSYHGGFSSLGGPDGPLRQAVAWKSDLNSDDSVHQLDAIMWLSTIHLNSKDWRKKGFARESVSSSLCFEKLRSDPSVIDRLNALKKSPNTWVREQAAFALENLARPLLPVEEAPNWG